MSTIEKLVDRLYSQGERFVNAVDWEYAGKRVALAIFLIVSLYLLVQLAVASARYGS